uniref:Uncharacterized protein n=1 Tax=Arundo donax TaxID=35708 RepID=A0A0A9BN47_ARUDO
MGIKSHPAQHHGVGSPELRQVAATATDWARVGYSPKWPSPDSEKMAALVWTRL